MVYSFASLHSINIIMPPAHNRCQAISVTPLKVDLDKMHSAQDYNVFQS